MAKIGIVKAYKQPELFAQWQIDGEKYIRTEIWFQQYKCDVSCDGKKHWTNSWVSGRLLTSGADCDCKGDSDVTTNIKNKERNKGKDSLRKKAKKNPS